MERYLDDEAPFQIALRGFKPALPPVKAFPVLLRTVRYFDSETCKELIFLTNNLDMPALTVAMLYKARWNIELFFRWIKGQEKQKE